jgi:GDP-L-fucose synthase
MVNIIQTMVKKIIVTGGTGLVGSGIKTIEDEYPDIEFFYLNQKDCDLKNYQDTLEVFKRIQPHTVIHLAANVGGLYKNMTQRVEMFEDNMLINLNVIRASYQTGVKDLLACLSTCVFPDGLVPLNETVLHNGAPHPSNEGYAYAKRMLELHCRLYTQQFGVNYRCIIPTNIYGKNDNYNLEDSHVIPGLIHRCYLAKQKGLPFVVRGSGKPIRQFIYNVDLARIIMTILQQQIKENIIASPNQEYSIGYIAKVIANSFDYDNIVFDSTFSDGQYSKTADNKKLMETFQNFRFTDLETGIHETVLYFINNYKIVKV